MGLNQTMYSIIIHSGQKQGSLISLPRRFQPADFQRDVPAVFNINLPSKKKNSSAFLSRANSIHLGRWYSINKDDTLISLYPTQRQVCCAALLETMQSSSNFILYKRSFQIQISQRKKPQHWDKPSDKCNFLADFMVFTELKKWLIRSTFLVCVLKQLEEMAFISV